MSIHAISGNEKVASTGEEELSSYFTDSIPNYHGTPLKVLSAKKDPPM